MAHPTRLTREESQALTRSRLLAAAKLLFGRDGYAATSVERITETAGYSKGAAYSNFESKEAIFLEVLEQQGQESLDALAAAIRAAPDRVTACEALVDWADDRSRSGGWALTILEHARHAGRGSDALRRQEKVIHQHWSQLGEALHDRFPGLRAQSDALTLGALLHEIAYAPAMTVMDVPTSGDLMRLAAPSLLAAAGDR
jgi:AcrR family transcriptional regulator